MEQVLWFLSGLGLGLALDFPLVKYLIRPLKVRIAHLESILELDSAQKMERVLMLEQELRWSRAKIQAQESDLERMNQKLTSGGMDLPQHRGTYWKSEWEKSQARVLYLEQELEKAQSQLVWAPQRGW